MLSYRMSTTVPLLLLQIAQFRTVSHGAIHLLHHYPDPRRLIYSGFPYSSSSFTSNRCFRLGCEYGVIPVGETGLGYTSFINTAALSVILIVSSCPICLASTQ